ncbi:FACT complex subunit SSRP1 [Porphyridium purpureum]|uniref:FACT complex subunit SSRP1 n=1 Tax=Porphyridium purpureum TaxID=35688 RepID=A0A5J4Z3I4_PORPP|nr:FACT complex subunit SSRP1 [Porphyridium purpureum]|eukprot:POR8993..scf295_1
MITMVKPVQDNLLNWYDKPITTVACGREDARGGSLVDNESMASQLLRNVLHRRHAVCEAVLPRMRAREHVLLPGNKQPGFLAGGTRARFCSSRDNGPPEDVDNGSEGALWLAQNIFHTPLPESVVPLANLPGNLPKTSEGREEPHDSGQTRELGSRETGFGEEVRVPNNDLIIKANTIGPQHKNQKRGKQRTGLGLDESHVPKLDLRIKANILGPQHKPPPGGKRKYGPGYIPKKLPRPYLPQTTKFAPVINAMYPKPPNPNTDPDSLELDEEVPLAVFPDVQLLKQRGFFEVSFYPKKFRMYVRLHTIDLSIPYSEVQRVFSFPSPRPKGAHRERVRVYVSLAHPIKMRGVSYSVIAFCFIVSKKVRFRMQNINETQLMNIYGDKLLIEEVGQWWSVFTNVMRHMVWKKEKIPNTIFSVLPRKPIHTRHRGFEGHLFFLEACFIYMKRPPMLIPYTDVEIMHILKYPPMKKPLEKDLTEQNLRGSMTLRVALKDSRKLTFNEISLRELGTLQKFLEVHHVPVVLNVVPPAESDAEKKDAFKNIIDYWEDDRVNLERGTYQDYIAMSVEELQRRAKRLKESGEESYDTLCRKEFQKRVERVKKEYNLPDFDLGEVDADVYEHAFDDPPWAEHS